MTLLSSVLRPHPRRQARSRAPHRRPVRGAVHLDNFGWSGSSFQMPSGSQTRSASAPLEGALPLGTTPLKDVLPEDVPPKVAAVAAWSCNSKRGGRTSASPAVRVEHSDITSAHVNFFSLSVLFGGTLGRRKICSMVEHDRCVMIRCEGRPVAAVSYRVFDVGTHVEAFISLLAVSDNKATGRYADQKPWRRRGFAGLLIGFVKEIVRHDAGGRPSRVELEADANEAVVGLYEKHGFVKGSITVPAVRCDIESVVPMVYAPAAVAGGMVTPPPNATQDAWEDPEKPPSGMRNMRGGPSSAPQGSARPSPVPSPRLASMNRGAEWEELHGRGYVVFRAGKHPVVLEQSDYKGGKMSPIFNGNDASVATGRSSHRLQARPLTNTFVSQVTGFLGRLNWLQTDTGVGRKAVKRLEDPNVVRSVCKCEDALQFAKTVSPKKGCTEPGCLGGCAR